MSRSADVPLVALERHDEFIQRHIGPRPAEIEAMLAALGVPDLATLIDQTVPQELRTAGPLPLPPAHGEREVQTRLRELAERNRVFVSMLGMGYYGTVLPPVIRRNVLENPGWYTAYTPYQAEVSQGRLEALMHFQHMVSDLTALPVANASLLDEATAVAEAMTMMRRIARRRPPRLLVDADCHPQTVAVLRTRARPLGIEVVVADPWQAVADHELFGVVVQYPGSSGALRDPRPVVEAAHAQGALVTLATDLLALTLITPPGELGADIAVGSAQRFGVPMSYGGPHAAFLATRSEHVRQVPGRIIGLSVDAEGRPALRMALQTREQHIRREKATSNICTAQVLLAVVAALYALYHGPEGLRTIALRVHRYALALARALAGLGYRTVNEAWFDTLTVHAPGVARRIAARARARGINLRVVDADHLGIALDETTRRGELASLLEAFATGAGERLDLDALDRDRRECIPPSLTRTSAYLQHPVFNRYHSETAMLRYLRRLAGRDIALDRSMIPLGSCTMKLNATTEMLPVTWRQFTALHPFAPLEQSQGYLALIEELESWLAAITGFDAISLQPNAGSQGEYTGLLVIRRWHESRGEGERDVCLIPASAHGTNPASAVLAGLRVVTVACDAEGNIDRADLAARAAEHADRLAALMVTYPSTHGVFEEGIRECIDIVHRHGGQVYLDGANMNALVGLCRPAELGVDVAHLNLHKTFCIPHGGGGPGAGPIGVRAHLAPFLPEHPLVDGVNPAARPGTSVGTVAAAPWGSAGILAISWAYIALMGGEGLTRATEVAILNANYIASRLAPHYPVLYRGRNGRVAHECIIDLRGIKAETGLSEEDVAKRLADYGFHAPTVSFPVAGTMMIEPTESEGLDELDRFCEAMIRIRREVAAVASGAMPADDNPLRHAPHTAEVLAADAWQRPYSRAEACFPAPWLAADKYWPPVARVDAVHGDRHLVCRWPDELDPQPAAAATAGG